MGWRVKRTTCCYVICRLVLSAHLHAEVFLPYSSCVGKERKRPTLVRKRCSRTPKGLQRCISDSRASMLEMNWWSVVAQLPFSVFQKCSAQCVGLIRWSRFGIRSLAADTKECFDFKCRVCYGSRQVILLWSRCLGLAPRFGGLGWVSACLRQNSTGRIPARTDRYSGSVGRRHPVTAHNALQ